jgi:hypothetical protein
LHHDTGGKRMHNNVYKNAWADRLWPIRPVRRTIAAARVPSKPVSPPCQAVQSTALWLPQGRWSPLAAACRRPNRGLWAAGEQTSAAPLLWRRPAFRGRGRLARRGAGTVAETITVDTRRRAQAATDRRIERIAARSDLWFEEPGVPIPPTPARNQSRRSGACVLSRGVGAGAQAGRVRQSPSAPRRSAPLVDEADQIKTREQRGR